MPYHQETCPRILGMYLDSHVQITMLAPRFLHKARNVFSHYIRGGANRLPPYLELSLVGQNLLDSHQKEFVSQLFSAETEVERGVYGKITWGF